MKLSLSTENTAANLRPIRKGSLVNTPVNRHGITVDTMSLQSFHDFDQSTTAEKSIRLASDDSLGFETPDSSFDSPPELPSPPIPPRQVPPQRPPPPQHFAAINHSTSLQSSAPSHNSDTHHSITPLFSSTLHSSGSNITNTSNYQSPSRYTPGHCPPLKPSRTTTKVSGSGFESDFVDANTSSSFASNHHSPRLMEPSVALPKAADRTFVREEVCVLYIFGKYGIKININVGM